MLGSAYGAKVKGRSTKYVAWGGIIGKMGADQKKGGLTMDMVISAIQFRPKAGDVEYNLARMSEMIGEAASRGARLAVLPEVADIGYHVPDVRRLAEEFPGPSTKRLSGIAAKNEMTIVCGMAERRLDKFFNTAAVFGPDGRLVMQYDKTHLCPLPPFNEPAAFEYGAKIRVAEVAGVKLGVSICYDIRFPEVYRRLMLDGAEVVAHPTAFPTIRIDQIEAYMRVRALENQFFMVSANCWGDVGGVDIGGNSMIVAPTGEILARGAATGDSVLTASIDTDDVADIRETMPVVTQRRPEIY